MTRVIVSLSLFTLALAGCRSPAPSFAPYGPQTVPAPVTGSIGTPAPQAAPYYQGSSTTTVPQNNVGWHPPSTSLGTQSLARAQTTTANPTATATNNNFATPQVTNPAAIGNPNGGFNAPQAAPSPNTVLGSGTRSAQTQPWQAPATTTGSPQLLNTGATPTAQPNAFNGQPATGGQNNWGQQPNSQWGQPPINNGSQLQTTPTSVPLNGMPVNDATIGYPQNNSSWSMANVRNWFQQQFGQPQYPQGYATQGYPTQGYPAQGYPTQGYAVQQAHGQQPIYQAQQQFPTTGYSTTAPSPTPLPVRGTQQQFIPASYNAPQATGGQNAPVAPAAMQWGSVPMAHATTGATVRGNDDAEVSAKGFVTTGQSSPTPHEAQRYGNHAEYKWLRGQLEYSVTSRQWKLRYIPLDAPEGRMDAYGGSVVLSAADELQGHESGDFVNVQGGLNPQDANASKINPRYDVTSISKL